MYIYSHFFAPYLRFSYTDISEDVTYASSTYNSNNYYTNISVEQNSYVRSYSGGLLFGVRMTGAENRFTTSIWAGGGLKASDVAGNQDYKDIYKIGYTGMIPRIGIQLGISF